MDRADEGGSIIIIGEGDSTLGVDNDVTALGQVRGGGDVEDIVESLARLQGGERIRGEVVALIAAVNTTKVDLRAWKERLVG